MRLQIRSPFAFALMPFASDFDKVYQCGIKRACEEAGVECERVDEQYFTNSIVERVYEQIARADLITPLPQVGKEEYLPDPLAAELTAG